MLRIHDIMTAFRGLHVPGLSFYPDRALILTGVAVVRDGPIDEHLAYLKDVGIGASEVIRVGSDALVDTLAGCEELRAEVLRHVAAGRRLQFFCTTDAEQAALDRLGLGWGATFSAPPAVSAEASSKSELRRLGARLGRADSFPAHRICRGRAQAYRAVSELFDFACDFIVLKRPDLASGDGMALVPKDRRWIAFAEPFMEEHGDHEVIVEAGYEHVPMSAQWELDDDGPRYVCGTGQIMDGRFVHLGNVLSSGDLPDVAARDHEEMRRISLPFVADYWDRGYRGICGFDFLRTRSTGETFLLECNGRVTATTYCYGLARQIRDRLPDWTIVMSNVKPGPSFRSFGEIRRAFGPLLFDGAVGVLPFNLRCLGLGTPKFTVCCVGRDVREAAALLETVDRRLS